MGNYKELMVWQKSVGLVTDIYSYTTQFPKEEIYSLTNQIRRSSLSIPSNIAEGRSRKSRIDDLKKFRLFKINGIQLFNSKIRRNLKNAHCIN